MLCRAFIAYIGQLYGTHAQESRAQPIFNQAHSSALLGLIEPYTVFIGKIGPITPYIEYTGPI